jgi:hypothetical protein
LETREIPRKWKTGAQNQTESITGFSPRKQLLLSFRSSPEFLKVGSAGPGASSQKKQPKETRIDEFISFQ